MIDYAAKTNEVIDQLTEQLSETIKKCEENHTSLAEAIMTYPSIVVNLCEMSAKLAKAKRVQAYNEELIEVCRTLTRADVLTNALYAELDVTTAMMMAPEEE